MRHVLYGLLLCCLMTRAVPIQGLPLDQADYTLVAIYTDFLRELQRRHLVPASDIDVLKWRSADRMALSEHPNSVVVGLCTLYFIPFGTYRTVHVLEGTKGNMLREVMFHELGHCLLNLEHSPDPRDIMYAFVDGKMSAQDIDRMLSVYGSGSNYIGGDAAVEGK